MRRVLLFGIIGAAAVVVLVVGLVIGVAVSPLRGQIGRLVSQAVVSLRPGAVQAQTVQLQLKSEKGVLVGGVFQDSPADQAGIARGDILLQMDGQDVNTASDLNGLLSKHKAGDSVKLLVQHGDAQKTVTVTLGTPVTNQTPQAQATPQNGQNNNPLMPRRFLDTNPFLGIVPIGAGQAYGKGGFPGTQEAGERIVEVASGSPAEKAGLKVGEVIVSVDGQAISGQNSLSTLLANHKPGDAVKLQVTGTDGAQRSVTVTLGDNPQKQGSAYLGVSVGRFGRGMFGFGGNRTMPGPGMMQHPGAWIQQVTTGSPAEKAGLKAGQVIQSVDGKALTSAQSLSDAITSHKPGDQVTLTVYDPQTNKSSDVKVTLGDNPQKAGSPWIGIEYGYFNMQNRPNTPQQTPNTNGTQF